MTIAVIAISALLLLAIAVKRFSGDWLYPGVFFCMIWVFASLVALSLAPEYLSSPTASLWILLNAVFVSFGTIVGTTLARSSYAPWSKHDRISVDRAPNRSHRLRNLTLACTVIGIGFAITLLNAEGTGLREILSPRGIAQMAMRMSIDRYGGKMQLSKGQQLLLTSAYVAPLLGGTLFVRRRGRKDATVSFLSLFPSILNFALESTRSSVLYGLIVWVAAYAATRISLRKPVSRIHLSRAQVVAALSAVPFLIGLIVAGDALRSGHGKAVHAGTELVSSRVKIYLCGHFAALSILLDSTDLDAQTANPGRYTLAGLYELGHPGTRQMGVTGLGGIYIPGGATNVNTYFWELILDYTAPGSLLVVLLLSVGSGFAYCKVVEGRMNWNGVLAASYAGMLQGNASLFNYNSMILAFFLYAIFCARPWRKRGEPAWGE